MQWQDHVPLQPWHLTLTGEHTLVQQKPLPTPTTTQHLLENPRVRTNK